MFALDSCLIFTENKFATSECILRDSDEDSRSMELIVGTINKFIFTSRLPSCRVLLL